MLTSGALSVMMALVYQKVMSCVGSSAILELILYIREHTLHNCIKHMCLGCVLAWLDVMCMSVCCLCTV